MPLRRTGGVAVVGGIVGLCLTDVLSRQGTDVWCFERGWLEMRSRAVLRESFGAFMRSRCM
jgi:hypothetical protein